MNLITKIYEEGFNPFIAKMIPQTVKADSSTNSGLPWVMKSFKEKVIDGLYRGRKEPLSLSTIQKQYPHVVRGLFVQISEYVDLMLKKVPGYNKLFTVYSKELVNDLRDLKKEFKIKYSILLEPKKAAFKTSKPNYSTMNHEEFIIVLHLDKVQIVGSGNLVDYTMLQKELDSVISDWLNTL
jgi:hypothetical protein